MSKPDLIYVPIEPLAERYTQQWYEFMPKYFAEHFNVTVIDGVPLTNTVEVGTFLDINSTVHYKNSQLMALARLFHEGKIKPGTRFFFGDLEFWGIESVRLMAQMNNIPVYLSAFLHAASYTAGDAFAIAASYQRFTEVGWYKAMDAVFVGSPYSRDAFKSRRLKGATVDISRQPGSTDDRIIVTGNPMFAEAYESFPGVTKKKQVVLTNRFDPEKNPIETLRLFQQAHEAHPDWKFVVTTGRKQLTQSPALREHLAAILEVFPELEIRVGLTKSEYHKTLAESLVMVSHSPEESFGYCAAEAAHYNCQPLLLRRASHPYLVDKSNANLFEYNLEALPKLEKLMADPVSTQSFSDRFFTKSMQKIISTLLP